MRFSPSFLSQGKMYVNFQSKICVYPLTFKSANPVPRLLFLGQTYPYANVALQNGMRLMLKVLFYP